MNDQTSERTHRRQFQAKLKQAEDEATIKSVTKRERELLKRRKIARELKEMHL